MVQDGTSAITSCPRHSTEEGEEMYPLTFKEISQKSLVLSFAFYCLIGQKLVTWPNLAVKKSENIFL